MSVKRVLLVASVGVVGTAVGLGSRYADGVPYQADWYGLEAASLPALVLYVVVGLLDTFFGWAIGPVLFGYLVGRRPEEPRATVEPGWTTRGMLRAVAIGASVMAMAISAYAVSTFLRSRAAAGELRNRGVDGSVPDSSLGEHLVMFLRPEMLPLAVVGGAIGGLAGYTARRFPPVLLVLVAAVGFDLTRRRDTAWDTAVNGPQNYLLVVAGALILGLTVVATVRWWSVARGAVAGETT